MDWLINLIGGGLIKEVKDGLLKAQQQFLQADNDREKLAAEQNVKYWQGRVDLAVAAAQHDKWWSTRELIGKIVLIYIFKLVIWDTVLAWGVTPDPGPVIGTIVATVIAFYFLSKPAEKVADALATRWIKNSS